MKINHNAEHLNVALGVSDEKYSAIAEEVCEEIVDNLKNDTKLKVTKIVEDVIKCVRQEHLNTTEEPSAYELELFVQGYLMGRILSPDHFNKLSIAATMKGFNEQL